MHILQCTDPSATVEVIWSKAILWRKKSEIVKNANTHFTNQLQQLLFVTKIKKNKDKTHLEYWLKL